MSKTFKKFYSKILLFGEYTIINGSEGLAIPLEKYYMQFTFENDPDVFENSNSLLKQYLSYVQTIFDKNIYDLVRFEKDIHQGLLVKSTIPVGYGLGSSGALVASFFHEYCINKEVFSHITALKNELGKLESYFHGSSSGLDPLVSYLNKGILIRNSNEIESIEVDNQINNALQLFLLNSNIERRTAPLVEIYKSKLENNPEFKLMINNILVDFNKQAIHYYLSGNLTKTTEIFNKIADFQYEFMKEMIPLSIASLCSNKEFKIKICGAGGGGFFLGMGNSNNIKDFELIKF